VSVCTFLTNGFILNIRITIKINSILAIRDPECLLPYIATMLIESKNSTQLETLIEVLSFGSNMAYFNASLVYALAKTDVSLSNMWNNINTLIR
jgi:hypothetical protein